MSRKVKLKYSIRTLLLSSMLTAVCASVARMSDWLAAVGLGAAAIIILAIGNWRPKHVASKSPRGLLLLVGTTAAWFSIVDMSQSIEWCKHCSEHRFTQEFRLCGIAVFANRGRNHVTSNLLRLKTDLGFPCNHSYERQHLVRLWGLVIAARPAIHITCCLSGDPTYYDDDVSKRIQTFASDHPIEAKAICEKIVAKEDYDEMHAFIRKMKQLE